MSCRISMPNHKMIELLDNVMFSRTHNLRFWSLRLTLITKRDPQKNLTPTPPKPQPNVNDVRRSFPENTQLPYPKICCSSTSWRENESTPLQFFLFCCVARVAILRWTENLSRHSLIHGGGTKKTIENKQNHYSTHGECWRLRKTALYDSSKKDSDVTSNIHLCTHELRQILQFTTRWAVQTTKTHSILQVLAAILLRRLYTPKNWLRGLSIPGLIKSNASQKSVQY